MSLRHDKSQKLTDMRIDRPMGSVMIGDPGYGLLSERFSRFLLFALHCFSCFLCSDAVCRVGSCCGYGVKKRKGECRGPLHSIIDANGLLQ